MVGAERGRGGLFVRKGSEGVGVGVRVSLIGMITKKRPESHSGSVIKNNVDLGWGRRERCTVVGNAL